MWAGYRLDLTHYVKYPLPTLVLAKYPIWLLLSDFYAVPIFLCLFRTGDVGLEGRPFFSASEFVYFWRGQVIKALLFRPGFQGNILISRMVCDTSLFFAEGVRVHTKHISCLRRHAIYNVSLQGEPHSVSIRKYQINKGKITLSLEDSIPTEIWVSAMSQLIH